MEWDYVLGDKIGKAVGSFLGKSRATSNGPERPDSGVIAFGDALRPSNKNLQCLLSDPSHQSE